MNGTFSFQTAGLSMRSLESTCYFTIKVLAFPANIWETFDARITIHKKENFLSVRKLYFISQSVCVCFGVKGKTTNVNCSKTFAFQSTVCNLKIEGYSVIQRAFFTATTGKCWQQEHLFHAMGKIHNWNICETIGFVPDWFWCVRRILLDVLWWDPVRLSGDSISVASLFSSPPVWKFCDEKESSPKLVVTLHNLTSKSCRKILTPVPVASWLDAIPNTKWLCHFWRNSCVLQARISCEEVNGTDRWVK